MPIVLMALALVAAVAGCASADRFDPARLDRAAHDAMARTGARGLALAMIEDGRVVALRAFGDRDGAGDALGPDTVMYGASLTKAVFADVVLQLVDDGLIDLDRPIADLLPRPLPDYPDLRGSPPWSSLAGDDRWRRLTPRLLLEHASGFANLSYPEDDKRLHLHFDPGARYAYSGDGLRLLQLAIEQGLGLDLAAETQRRGFEPLGMRRTSLRWADGPRDADVADGWDADGDLQAHRHKSRVDEAGSMDTTIADFARFAAALVRGEGLSPRMRAELGRLQLPIGTASQFPTLQPELPRDRWRPGFGAGLGVLVFDGPQGRGFYKGGHDESTANTMVCLDGGRRCVVALSNDVRIEAVYGALVDGLLGTSGVPWDWEYPPPTPR